MSSRCISFSSRGAPTPMKACARVLPIRCGSSRASGSSVSCRARMRRRRSSSRPRRSTCRSPTIARVRISIRPSFRPKRCSKRSPATGGPSGGASASVVPPNRCSTPQARARYRLGRLPAPYENFADAVDGRAVFVSGVLAGHAIWAEVPIAGARSLVIIGTRIQRVVRSRGHRSARTRSRGRRRRLVHGGWRSGGRRRSRGRRRRAESREVIPGRLDYPGAPHPRWWQLENRAVDIGGFSPDRSHFATMLLLDVALEHADDWFTFPVPPPAGAGHDAVQRCARHSRGRHRARQLRRSVGSERAAGLGTPATGRSFTRAGLSESQLLVWPVAVAPHGGPCWTRS